MEFIKNTSDSMQSTINELSGENYSSASGKEEVASLYANYIASLNELGLIDANISNKRDLIAGFDEAFATDLARLMKVKTDADKVVANIQRDIDSDTVEYKRIEADTNSCVRQPRGIYQCNSGRHDSIWINEQLAGITVIKNRLPQKEVNRDSALETVNTAIGEYNNFRNNGLGKINRDLNTLNAQRTVASKKLAQYKAQYDSALKVYNDAVANENRISAEKITADANLTLQEKKALLEANENKARIELEKQTALANLELERAKFEAENGIIKAPAPAPVVETPSKGMLSSITKKQWLIGGGIIVVVGGFLAYNLGWFKGAVRR